MTCSEHLHEEYHYKRVTRNTAVLTFHLEVNTKNLVRVYFAIGPQNTKGNNTKKNVLHQVHLLYLRVLIITSLHNLTGKHQANLTYMF